MPLKYKPLPSKADLEAEFILNEDTGELLNRVSRRRGGKAGDVAGSLEKIGYVAIGFKGKVYRAHRLIAVMVYGGVPDGCEVDHINFIRSDNRPVNLRLVRRVDNNRHVRPRQGTQRRNRSGVSGICYMPGYSQKNPWRATISSKHLGHFPTKEAAIAARKNAEREHGYPVANT